MDYFNMSSTLSANGINIGFYPDEGDAGGTKSYLSDLNAALASSWPQHAHAPAPTISVVGWYAQTYPGEEFNGFQLMPLVDDIKREAVRCGPRAPRWVYEASVMPFQSWTGYTPDNHTKAREVASVMQSMLERSRLSDGRFAIDEIRLRFGHEMNYYIKSGLYPPPTTSDPGYDFRTAFDQVALAIHALPSSYSSKVKMFWCPNIASTSSGALAEYETFRPTLEHIDYVGIDYYCPAPGSLRASDFVRKMKPLHDRYCSAARPFVLGETGLHFDESEGGNTDAKLAWLDAVTGKEARRGLPHMVGVSWFNYEKDRDYRLVWIGEREKRDNRPFVEWLARHTDRARTSEQQDEKQQGGKVKKFWETLLAK